MFRIQSRKRPGYSQEKVWLRKEGRLEKRDLPTNTGLRVRIQIEKVVGGSQETAECHLKEP